MNHSIFSALRCNSPSDIKQFAANSKPPVRTSVPLGGIHIEFSSTACFFPFL